MNMTVFQILLSLQDGPQNASDILDIIGDLDMHGRPPSLASFYRHLKRAVDEGWLEIIADASPPKNAGRPGQIYRMTKKGTSAVRAEAVRLRDLSSLALTGRTIAKSKRDA